MQRKKYYPKKWTIHISSRRWANKICWRRSGTENVHLDTGSPNSRRKSPWFSWRIRRVSSTTPRLVSGCRWSDKWFLVHVRKLHLPPSRWTQSQTLLAERRIIPYSTEVHWRLQNYSYQLECYARKSHRWLLEYRWIKRFVRLSEKPPEGYVSSGERLTKRQATSMPEHLWPELWTKFRRNAKLREKHKWAYEKPKLDNARRLRGIYFIDPEDMEPLGMHERKLETPIAPAMPCKTSKKCKHGETRSKTNDFKSKFACILEVNESTRMRMEESLPKYHEDHIAGKGDNSLQDYNLVHKFIPMPQAMKIPAAKAAVNKEWEILKRFQRETKQKSETNLKWLMKQEKKVEKYTSLHWWTSVIWRMPNWSHSTKNTKVELYSEAILWKMILDLMQYSLNKDHQHLKWQ